MDHPYAGGWLPQSYGGGGSGASTVPRCWERPCRSTDPSPMRPFEHGMRSTEAMRSMESMRSIDSIIRQPPSDPMRTSIERHQSIRPMEGMSRSMEQIRTEQPRSVVDHPTASSSSISPGTMDHRVMRAIEHPCRLKDHAGHVHDHHFGRPHEHGCRSVEHVSRLLEHRQHEAQHPPIRPSLEQAACRPAEHPPAARPPFNYSCRSLDHAPGRPIPMDCVVYGPHTHPPPRLPAESPFRINCPVHSPFRFRFPNGAGTAEYHSHSQIHLRLHYKRTQTNAIDKVNNNVARAGGELRCYSSRQTKGSIFNRVYRSFVDDSV
ncbi:hypothetical protein HN011_003343 [Eciton burchellii]|nr:hypothetical protein HN011_003343 [Eciton burchellii]